MEETDVDEALANTYAAIEMFKGVVLPADQYAEAFHKWRTGKLPPTVTREVDVFDILSFEKEEIVFTPLFEKGVIGFAAGGLPIPTEAVETLRQLVRWSEEYRTGEAFAPQRVAAVLSNQ